MPRIFIAEDDDNMVSLLKTLLGIEGYQVTTLLEKCDDIIETIRCDKPDVVLLDVHLGKINGIELVRKMRQTADLKGIKVIMNSGMEMHDQCLAAGADGFLLKPYDPNDLIGMLRAHTK